MSEALSMLALGLAAQGGGGGTEYTAGEGIDITNNEISVDKDTVVTKEYGTAKFVDTDGCELGISSAGMYHDKYNGDDFISESSLDADNGLYLQYYEDPTSSDYNMIQLNAEEMALNWQTSDGEEGSVDITQLGQGGSTEYTAGEGIAINSDNEISALVDGETIQFNEDGELTAIGGGTEVSGTNDGTNWTSLTIDDDTYAIPSGGGSSYTFTNGLTESSGTVSWDLNDFVQGSNTAHSQTNPNNKGIAIGSGYISTGANSLIVGSTTKSASGNTGLSASSNSLVVGNGGYGEMAITTGGDGSVAFGRAVGNMTKQFEIRANSSGSVAFGQANNSYGIRSNNIAAIASGFVGIDGTTSNYVIDAKGYASLARGCSLEAGSNVTAIGKVSTAIGTGVTATDDYSIALGKWQDNTNPNFALNIGNGTSDSARSNALTVDWNGNLVCNNIPAPPSEDGEYDLHCSIVDGAITYSWVARE